MKKLKHPKGIQRPWDRINNKAFAKSDYYCLMQGNAQSVLSKLPVDFVNTCLTSPPYWGARDYGQKHQLGQEDKLELYISRLVDVFREIKRVLRTDGTAWLNLGDCYLHRSPAADNDWKCNKQLALVPFRVAISLQDDGWLVRNVAVWHKPNAMPASVRDRLTNVWEPVFLLSKSPEYYFNLDAIREPHKTSDDAERLRAIKGNNNGKARGRDELRRWLNSPRHRTTIEGIREIRRRPNAPAATELAGYLRQHAEVKGLSIGDVAAHLGQPFERVRHYLRTDKIGARLPPEETWEKLKTLLDLGTEFDDAMAVEVGDNVFRNHPNGRNPGDLKSFPVTRGPLEHFAMMSPPLAEWALKATLPKGGLCLDPFMGVGTTAHAAIKLGGRFLGIDVRKDFLKLFAASQKEMGRLSQVG